MLLSTVFGQTYGALLNEVEGLVLIALVRNCGVDMKNLTSLKMTSPVLTSLNERPSAIFVA